MSTHCITPATSHGIPGYPTVSHILTTISHGVYGFTASTVSHSIPRYPADLPRCPTVYTVSRYPPKFPRCRTESHGISRTYHDIPRCIRFHGVPSTSHGIPRYPTYLPRFPTVYTVSSHRTVTVSDSIPPYSTVSRYIPGYPAGFLRYPTVSHRLLTASHYISHTISRYLADLRYLSHCTRYRV